MRLIKFRDGFTPTGNLVANFLQDSTLEQVTKRSIDSLVRRNGDLTNVWKTEQDVAAIYTVGRTTGSVWQVRGSTTGRGTFGYVGAPDNAVSIDPNFYIYGRGLGESYKLTQPVPTVNDFNAQPWAQARYTISRSRNGVAPTGYFAVDTISPFVLAGVQYQIEGLPPGVRKVGGVNTFYTGQTLTQMVGDQPAHKFICDDGVSPVQGGTIGYPNAVAWFANTFTLAPGVLFKVDRYLRGGTSYTNVPPLVMTYSLDAGMTWTAAPTATLVDTEMATINALVTTTSPEINKFRDAVAASRFFIAPLSRTLSVVLAVVPYIDSGTVKARVKMGTLDATTMVMSGSVVLYDNAATVNAYNFLKDVLATRTGVLVFTRPMVPDTTGIWNRPARIQKTSDGVSLADVAYMPFIEARTGNVKALTTNSIVCPMYDDSAYRLYGTNDFGATWKERAVITTDGLGPPGGQNLVDFKEVAFIRRNNIAANAFPATPWLTDIRINP